MEGRLRVGDVNRKAGWILGTLMLTTGIAVASYILWSRTRGDQMDEPSIRSVKELLDECYEKIREIQQNLSDLPPASVTSPSPTR
jgi:hypothetical protein